MIDKDALRNVDPDDIIYRTENREWISGGSEEADSIINGGSGTDFYPDDLVFVMFHVSCDDELANGFEIQFRGGSSSGNVIYETHSGDGSSPEELKQVVQGSFMFAGRQLVSSEDDFPEGLDLAIQNDGSSGKSFTYGVQVWTLQDDYARADAGGRIFDGHFTGASEGFDA